jgi:hypothetical protein
MPHASPLDQLWRSFPEERENLRPYVQRAQAYSSECGCAMGGAFAVISLGFLILCAVLFNGIGTGTFLTDLACGLVTVIVSCGVGKLCGVALARVQLSLLYRRLRTQYADRGI